MEIKIVGSVSDREEIDTIKRITEIFLIEKRIKDMVIEKKNIYEKL
jgi:hypothetical protein